MAYDDLYGHSETKKIIDKRKEVGYVGMGSDGYKRNWCPVCKYVLKPYDNGNLICPSCGKETDIRKIRAEKKLVSKFDTSTGPILMSKGKRSKDRSKEWADSVNQDLTEEDKAELRAAGFMI